MKLPKPSRWRFSLKSLLIAVTLAGGVLGLYEQILYSLALPFALLASGLTGESWMGFWGLWLSAWYLEQIHKALGESPGTRGVLPAKWGMLLLTLGAAWALLVEQGLISYAFRRNHDFLSDNDDLIAIYCLLLGFALLLIWLPRRIFWESYGESESRHQDWAKRLSKVAILLSALSFAALMPPLLDIFTIPGLEGLGGALVICLGLLGAQWLAAFLLAGSIALQVVEDRYLGWKTIATLAYPAIVLLGCSLLGVY